MSWFDATGLANIAKSALKEAQKTIDKALDIRDDVDENDEADQKTSQNTGEGDFFASWGLNEKSKKGDTPEDNSNMKEVNETPVKANMPNSLWGSFTGSFFEVDKTSKSKEKNEDLISTQPQKFSLLFPNESDGVAPLATPENELTPIEGASEFADKSSNKKIEELDKKNEDLGKENNLGIIMNHKGVDEVPSNLMEDKVIIRPKARRNSSNRSSYISNRLSIISTESEGKRSSESVEVLTSLSCTTSPDDFPSISNSSSMGLPVSSSCTDSVEVSNNE